MGSVKRCPPNCPDRSWQPNCHSTCEIYLAQQEKNRKEREARQAAAQIDSYYVEKTIERSDKFKKSRKGRPLL